MAYAILGGAIVIFVFALIANLVGGNVIDIENNPVVAFGILGTIIYAILLLAIFIQIVVVRKTSWRDLGYRAPPLVPLLLVPVIGFGQLLAAALVNAAILALTGEFDNPQVESITGGLGFSWTNFIAMLVLVGIVAPIVEETFFRGVLYGYLRTRMPIVLAVTVSAVIFSAVHVYPILLPALFVVGLILAAVYEWTKSLWIPILLHMMQNSLAVIAIFATLAIGAPTQ